MHILVDDMYWFDLHFLYVENNTLDKMFYSMFAATINVASKGPITLITFI